MESNDQTQAQPDAPIAQRRTSRRPLLRLAGATVLVGGLAAGGLAVSHGAQSSVANAGSSTGVTAQQVCKRGSKRHREPLPSPGFSGGPGHALRNMAGRFGGGTDRFGCER